MRLRLVPVLYATVEERYVPVLEAGAWKEISCGSFLVIVPGLKGCKSQVGLVEVAEEVC